MCGGVKDAAYKELCPASLYDVAANETWLEDRTREDWRLGDQVWDVSDRNCGDLTERLDEYAAVLAAGEEG